MTEEPVRHEDFIDRGARRQVNAGPGIPLIPLHVLESWPRLARGHDADLRAEIERNGYRFRYWVSRVGYYDRPTFTRDGRELRYTWPAIEVEAQINGCWKLVHGYQGVMN